MRYFPSLLPRRSPRLRAAIAALYQSGREGEPLSASRARFERSRRRSRVAGLPGLPGLAGLALALLATGCAPTEPVGSLDERAWLSHRGQPVFALDDRLRRDWYGRADDRLWVPMVDQDALRLGSIKGRCSVGAAGVTSRQRKPLRVGLRFLEARDEVPVRLRGDCAWSGAPATPAEGGGVRLDRDWRATWRIGLRDPAELRVRVEGGPLTLEVEGQPHRLAPGEHALPLRAGAAPARIEAHAEQPATLSLGLVRAQAPVTPAPARVDHVLVLLVDTLRADRLRAYAPQSRVPTPALDRLAADGDVFLDAHAVASWTKPAVASVLTGLYPWQHGAFSHEAVVREDAPLLGEHLRPWGVRTAAFVGNGYVSAPYGFDRGWDHFVPGGSRGGRVADLSDEYLRWLDAHRQEAPEQPTFAYVHAVDPHSPYAAPDSFVRAFDPQDYAGPIDFTDDALLLRRIERGELVPSARDQERLIALYDAEVAQMDRAVGALLDGLAARGLLERTLLVFVADHGEELFDHGSVGHGGLRLHPELVRVPLIVRWPGVTAGRRVRGAVSQIDIAPTVFDALEVAPDGFGAAGARSLRQSATATDERFVMLSEGRRRVAVTDGTRMLIRGRDGRFEGESEPELRRWMLDAMAREMERHPVRRRTDKVRDVPFDEPVRRAPIDQDLAEQLRALGYLGDENTE